MAPSCLKECNLCWRDLVWAGDVGHPPEIIHRLKSPLLFSTDKLFQYLTNEKKLATGWLHGRVKFFIEVPVHVASR